MIGLLAAELPESSAFLAGEEIDLVLSATESQFLRWRSSSAIERAKALSRWHDLILEHHEVLASLVSREQEKPIREAIAEIENAASYFG